MYIIRAIATTLKTLKRRQISIGTHLTFWNIGFPIRISTALFTTRVLATADITWHLIANFTQRSLDRVFTRFNRVNCSNLYIFQEIIYSIPHTKHSVALESCLRYSHYGDMPTLDPHVGLIRVNHGVSTVSQLTLDDIGLVH